MHLQKEKEREREKKKKTAFTGPFFVALRALLFASCAVLLFVVPLPCAAGLLSLAASLLVASLSNRWRNKGNTRLRIGRTQGIAGHVWGPMWGQCVLPCLALEQVQVSLPEGRNEGKLQRRFEKCCGCRKNVIYIIYIRQKISHLCAHTPSFRWSQNALHKTDVHQSQGQDWGVELRQILQIYANDDSTLKVG